MTDAEQKFTIPVAFEVAGTTREQAAELLHTLLARADRLLTDAAPLRDLGDVFYPLEDRWFPEGGLKHIDGNTHADMRLREPHPFADTYADTPVFDMLAEIFPEEPGPDTFRDEHGEVDENAYGAAFDEFTEQALDIALYGRRPPGPPARPGPHRTADPPHEPRTGRRCPGCVPARGNPPIRGHRDATEPSPRRSP